MLQLHTVLVYISASACQESAGEAGAHTETRQREPTWRWALAGTGAGTFEGGSWHGHLA